MAAAVAPKRHTRGRCGKTTTCQVSPRKGILIVQVGPVTLHTGCGAAQHGYLRSLRINLDHTNSVSAERCQRRGRCQAIEGLQDHMLTTVPGVNFPFHPQQIAGLKA